MEENVNALKIELSEEILSEIEKIHEETRNPACFYSESPDLCTEASWIKGARPASKPE